MSTAPGLREGPVPGAGPPCPGLPPGLEGSWEELTLIPTSDAGQHRPPSSMSLPGPQRAASVLRPVRPGDRRELLSLTSAGGGAVTRTRWAPWVSELQVAPLAFLPLLREDSPSFFWGPNGTEDPSYRLRHRTKGAPGSESHVQLWLSIRSSTRAPPSLRRHSLRRQQRCCPFHASPTCPTPGGTGVPLARHVGCGDTMRARSGLCCNGKP